MKNNKLPWPDPITPHPGSVPCKVVPIADLEAFRELCEMAKNIDPDYSDYDDRIDIFVTLAQKLWHEIFEKKK